MDVFSILERAAVELPLASALLLMIWKLGNRLLDSHDRFLRAMESETRAHGDRLTKVERGQDLLIAKVGTMVCRYEERDAHQQHSSQTGQASPHPAAG